MKNNIFTFIVVVAILVFIVSFGTNTGKQAQTAQEWTRINHDDFNFSIEAPNRFTRILSNESGFKHGDDVRLIIYTNSWQLPSRFSIRVETLSFDNPTLVDVVNWGNEPLDEIKSDPVRLINSGLEEIFLNEEKIGNVDVLRRRYAYYQSEILVEEIYIAREKDMVILRLRVDEEYFDYSLKIFNRMVNSFEPLE